MTRIRQKQNKKKSKIKNVIILLFILLFFLAVYAGICAVKWQNLASDMFQNTSSIVLDTDGNKIAELGNEKNRKNISYTEIPEDLIHAYVAIEDERFYSHFGVDIRRTGAAILNYITRKTSTFGGSTITQQLVKNLTGDKDTTISRKVSEWFRAASLEMRFSKEEILETYLNVIYVGPNIYGVENGAQYYFDKTVSELDLAEMAFLAGINISPNTYTPFSQADNQEKIEKRIKTVLSKMQELGYISAEEATEATSEVEKGLSFKKGKIENDSSNIYSYHTDALLTQLIDDLAKQKHISTNFATNYLHMANLKIYSTQNSNIQKTLEKEMEQKKYIIPSANTSDATSQAAMVIIDQKNGQVLGCVGGLGEKKDSRGFNRATQAVRQTGSAGKPIAVLAPAIDKKVITASTMLLDEATTFDDGSEEGYSPIDYNDFLGEITVRRAVESSQNIPFVKIMEEITPKVSIRYMKKMGITTLTKVDDNINLALGGLDKGIKPLEMAAAYATISNGGTYIEPTFYTEVKNQAGDTVIHAKQKTRRVFSEAVAYVLTELLTQPVTGKEGTATYCAIPHIEVSAKTGTTNENYDRWLCGFTPYYTAVTWYGFDINETINYQEKNPAGLIWSSVMRSIHSDLDHASFTMPKRCRKGYDLQKNGFICNR